MTATPNVPRMGKYDSHAGQLNPTDQLTIEVPLVAHRALRNSLGEEMRCSARVENGDLVLFHDADARRRLREKKRDGAAYCYALQLDARQVPDIVGLPAFALCPIEITYQTGRVVLHTPPEDRRSAPRQLNHRDGATKRSNPMGVKVEITYPDGSSETFEGISFVRAIEARQGLMVEET